MSIKKVIEMAMRVKLLGSAIIDVSVPNIPMAIRIIDPIFFIFILSISQKPPE